MNEDSFNRIKKLMKIIGGKAIIIEDGKPAFVIINTDEFMEFEDARQRAGTTPCPQPGNEGEPGRLEGDFDAPQAKEGDYVILDEDPNL